MKIVLAGCTGFIGDALLQKLIQENHEITLLARHPNLSHGAPKGRIVKWDGKTEGPWEQWIDGAEAVINLAGDPIAQGRWTQKKKERIKNSRLDSTKALANAIKKAKQKPRVLINASAIGYYGNVLSGDVDETHEKGSGFLAEVCSEWENQAKTVEADGVRLVLLRIGIVLGQGGGALTKMVPPFKLFAGGPLGSGTQWFPWIHLDDIIGAILFSLHSQNLSGAVNATAPNPLTMKEFCHVLGKVLRRPSWAPVPGFIVRLGLGEMSDMLLQGQKVVPKRLEASGYTFSYPTAKEALESILK